MDEPFLIAQAKNGDKAATEKLIEKYAPLVFNLSLKFMCNYHNASDAAQDALIKIFSSVKKFRGDSSFSTWVYRITYNTCVDLQRKQKSNAVAELNPSMESALPSPYAQTEKNEKSKIINDAIKKLPDKYRAAIVLRDIWGNSYYEISKILNCSVGTVKSRISRGRLRLKELLSDYMEQSSAGIRQNN